MVINASKQNNANSWIRKIDRIKSAVRATDILLTRDQWFEIYVASRGVDIP